MTRPNPRLIGGFILGGVGLAILGTAWLAFAHAAERKHTFVIFFPQAVRGLEVGSQVTLIGVPVGEVSRIQVYLTTPDPHGGTPQSQIQVTVRVSGDFVRPPPGARNEFEGLAGWDLANRLRERGLRAEVMNASLVTGQLYIDLDFHPELPARMTDVKTDDPQLPSAPNSLELLGEHVRETLDRVSRLPLERIASDMAEALEAVRDLAREGEIRTALGAASGAGRGLEKTLADIDRLVVDAQGKLDEVEPGQVAREFSATLSALRQSLITLQGAVGGAGGMEADLDRTLHEIRRAAASVRTLAEYLERHPEALLDGKPRPGAQDP